MVDRVLNGHSRRSLSLRSGPEQQAIAALLVLTLLRSLVAATTPLSPDEAYYWVWSRALASGYLDHPPMVALWVRAGTALFGPTALGIRLLAPVSAAAGSLLLWQAARDLRLSRDAALRCVAALNATLLFGAGAVTMTPDTPLLFFWTAAIAASARLVATGRAGWWLAIGAAGGLALCSKYTAVLLPVGLALWLVWARQWRWLTHPAPYLGAALGVALFVPTMFWNAQHGWASFAKQGGRGLVFDPSRIGAHVTELIGGQAGLATPILFVLFVLGVTLTCRAAARTRASEPVLLIAFVLPALALFAEHALGDRVQANWVAIIYPAAALCTAFAPQRWLWPGVWLGAVVTAVVYAQASVGLLPLPARLDPTLRLSGGYADLARDVAAAAAREQAAFVAVDDYGPASLLALLTKPCLPVVGVELRWGVFDLPDARGTLQGRVGLLLRSANRNSPPATADWNGLAPVGMLNRIRSGQVAERYRLYRGVLRTGPMAAAAMPCGTGN